MTAFYKYEGELSYEGMEYDFEIDANSGTFFGMDRRKTGWNIGLTNK